MDKKMRGRNAFMVCAVAVGALFVQSAPADALSFFDRVFNTPAYKDHQRRQDLIRKRETAPKIRVSSPRYYTYKPDVLKTISLADLAVAAPMPDAISQDEPDAAPMDAPETSPDAATATHDSVDGPQTTGTVTAASVQEVVPPATVAFDETRGHLADMKLRSLAEVGPAIKSYYGEHPSYIWISDGVVNARARAALETLAKAEDVGLDPLDYAIELPQFVDASATSDDTVDLTEEDLQGRALMRFEMDFSAKVLTYVLDAQRGRVDPNRLSGYHDLPRRKVDLAAALGVLSSADDVASSLVAFNPDNAQFKALTRELAVQRAAEGTTNRIEIADGTLLKPGRKDPEMANVVAAIRQQGSEALLQAHAVTLGAYANTEEYTPDLVAFVKDFQREKKLTPDGVVGRNTIRALVGVSHASKIAKLKLAMERTRWLPQELGDRKVFINQPAFTATYTQTGRDPLAMRVVVGKKSNQTNFFYDTIETVEFNPYWGVPYSIIVNEMMPKLNEDPGYLDRIGYEVTTVNGQRVSSASVDWHSVATRQSSINVRQLPGRSNALGELKILFPNKHAIYMHDTPSKNLFKRDARAFSHGCVRLADPRAMAAAVLGKSTDYVASRIGQGKNDSDDVAGNIPVYVAYFTAWPDENGKVGFYHDVYDRDAYLTKAIEATVKPRRAKS